jgi:hypothetical protein
MMVKISVDQALELISRGVSLESYDVAIDKPLDAVKAFHLRKNGVNVPDDLISYEDDDLSYDEDFDEGEWTRLPKKIDENIFDLANGLSLTDEERKWLEEKDVEINVLLSQLLKSYIKTDKLITRLDAADNQT